MITLEEAAVVANVDRQTIHTLVEAGKLHSIQTSEPTLLVCLNSLINFRRNSENPGEQ
jgi:hypothetical protein